MHPHRHERAVDLVHDSLFCRAQGPVWALIGWRAVEHRRLRDSIRVCFLFLLFLLPRATPSATKAAPIEGTAPRQRWESPKIGPPAVRNPDVGWRINNSILFPPVVRTLRCPDTAAPQPDTRARWLRACTRARQQIQNDRRVQPDFIYMGSGRI